MTYPVLKLVGGRYDGAEVPMRHNITPPRVWIERTRPEAKPADGGLVVTSYQAESWHTPPPNALPIDATYLRCTDGLYREQAMKEAVGL